MSKRVFSRYTAEKVINGLLLFCAWNFLLTLIWAAYRVTWPGWSDTRQFIRAAVSALAFLLYLERRRRTYDR